MAILGSTSEPTSSAEAFSSSYNTFSINLIFPGGGPWRITRAAVWAAGYGASPSAVTAVWDSSGNLLTNSGAFTLTARTFSNSGSDLYDAAVSPYVVAGGTTVKVGFGISPLTSGCFFGKLASGAWQKKDNTSFLGSMAGATAGTGGAFGAYLTYEVANQAPSVPSSLTPGSGIIIGTDLTPDLSFYYSDPDGNNSIAYQIQVDEPGGDFSSPIWDSGVVGHVAASGTTITVPVGITLSRGTTYWWRAHVWDSSWVASGWGYT